MRISGYGAGFGGQPEGGRDRAAAFRARHSVGQRIKGRIMLREASGLYWVLVGGEELLARLEVQADPGDELMFTVRALTPEIMLRALPGGVDAEDLPGLVQRFRAAREVFETQHAGILTALRSLPPQSAPRREAFDHALAAEPEAARQHDETMQRLALVNAVIAGRGATAQYAPWLLPDLRRMEGLMPGAGAETILSATSPACGEIEARLSEAQSRLLVSAANPEAAGPLLVELADIARARLGREPTVLGPMRLRPTPFGGALGTLFAEAPTWTAGGLNTRV